MTEEETHSFGRAQSDSGQVDGKIAALASFRMKPDSEIWILSPANT
jgi:hypothetical protein